MTAQCAASKAQRCALRPAARGGGFGASSDVAGGGAGALPGAGANGSVAAGETALESG
jgi:hypothetical protein